MKVICLASYVFLVGLTVHYLFKDSHTQITWDKCYFLWDKMKDLLLFFGYLCFIPNDRKEIRSSIKAICVFCVIRIAWEFLKIETDYVFATSYRVIDVMFALLLLVISWVWVKSSIRNGKERSINLGARRNSRVQHDRNRDHI